MDIFSTLPFLVGAASTYALIIAASAVIIISFVFGEVAKKTSIPSVLMLIILGIVANIALADKLDGFDFNSILPILGTVGLIMIVLEAALELELKREKLLPIAKSMLIAFIGLIASAWAAAMILQHFVPGMTSVSAWLYATTLSILSSAIIIPSVGGLRPDKKEFHIYESTFSDIMGIMLFYYLAGQLEAQEGTHGSGEFFFNIFLTIIISLIISYLIVLIFQNIKSHVKLFLLIAVLLLFYSLGKLQHLSSLLMILIFGLLIANMKLFFFGPLKKYLNYKEAHHIYEGLHVITMETAFVIRTFFFVIFGITIVLSSLANMEVALISGLIILSIYAIRYIILRFFIGSDILPQLFIAPRGLITILLFYAIPKEAEIAGFEPGILLYTIIGTSLIMTAAMIYDKNRGGKAVKTAESSPVGYRRWEAPSVVPTEE